LEGKEISINEIKELKGNKQKVLGAATEKTELNLYGIKLSQALYYVGKEVPLIARIGKDHFVVIMSYNSAKVRYMDPLGGKEVVLKRSELEDKIRYYGNEYYSYVK
jgi:ABC-type bacteriocin/lantibiotic exporter with double-glycine peptidase domain